MDDLSSKVPTVFVDGPNGPIRVNKSDYDEAPDKFGALIPDDDPRVGGSPTPAPRLNSEVRPGQDASTPATMQQPQPSPNEPPSPNSQMTVVNSPVPTNPAPPKEQTTENDQYQYANPDDPKYTAQIGSRWFVVNQQGRKFQKGQSAAGYATQQEAEATAVKMAAAQPVPSAAPSAPPVAQPPDGTTPPQT